MDGSKWFILVVIIVVITLVSQLPTFMYAEMQWGTSEGDISALGQQWQMVIIKNMDSLTSINCNKNINKNNNRFI